MIYFKHYTDANKGTSMQGLLNEFGHTGLCYWVLVEMCAEKLTYDHGNGLTELDCQFRFSERIVRQNLRISRTNLQHFLDKCSEFSLLTWELVGNELRIEMPKLLECLDSDQKRARKLSASKAHTARLDIDKDKDIYKDVLIQKEPEKFNMLYLYEKYPLKIGKTEGLSRLKKIIKTEKDFQDFEKAIDLYKSFLQDTDTKPEFVKHFTSFIGPVSKPAWRDWLDYKPTKLKPRNIESEYR